MAGKFEIIKDKVGKYRFHLKAANGEIIAASQAYDQGQREDRHRVAKEERTRRDDHRPN